VEEDEIGKAGLSFDRQLPLPVTYDGLVIDAGYRLDLLVLKRVVLEVKSVDKLVDIHRAQLLSYLKLGGFRLAQLQRRAAEARDRANGEQPLTLCDLRAYSASSAVRSGLRRLARHED